MLILFIRQKMVNLILRFITCIKNFEEYMEELKYTARNYNEGKISIDEFLLAFSENDEGFVGNFVYAGKKVIKVVGSLYDYFTDERIV